MGKKEWGVLAAAVLVAAAILVVWQFTGETEGPAEAPPVEPVVTETAPAEEEPAEPESVAETPEPEAEPAETEVAETVPDILDEIGEPDDVGGALLALPDQKEPAFLDPRCRELLEAMKEKLGWHDIRTMTCKMKMDMGPMGSMEGEITLETIPGQETGKMCNIFEIKMGEAVRGGPMQGQTMKMYQITDGVFMEMGTISPDGKRTPMNFGEYDPSQGGMGPGFTGEMFNTETFDYDEALDIKADPSERMFQKEDGSAIDNLDLVQLTAGKEKQSFEMFVDPETMKMVGMRLYVGDALMMEMSQLKYEQIAEGVLYPVGYQIHMDPSAMGNPQAPKMDMKLEMSDIVVNEPIDPATFHFTANPQK